MRLYDVLLAKKCGVGAGSFYDALLGRYLGKNYPTKGDIIQIDMDGDGTDEQYLVLRVVGDTVVECLARTTPSGGTSIKFASSGQTYAGGDLDNFLNTTYYATLSAKAKSAIVQNTINQDSWKDSSGGVADYKGNYSSSKTAYTISLVNASLGNDIDRNIYALSVQDIIDYLGVTTEMSAAESTLNSDNIRAMFNVSGTHPIWLRSAYSVVNFGAMLVIPSSKVDCTAAYAPYNARPAFQIDLSKIPWRPSMGYPITASVTNGSVSGASYIRAGQTVTLQVVPASNYTYPASVSVSGATASYNASTGALILSEPTGDVSISASCRAIRSISVSVTNGSYSGDAQIIEGGSASVTITASEGYVLPSTVTVTGATASYNSATGVISLSSPTANVVVAAECPAAGPLRRIDIMGYGAPSACCCWLASAPGTVYYDPTTINARQGDELVCRVDVEGWNNVLLDNDSVALTNNECRIPINSDFRVELNFSPPEVAVIVVYTIISDLTGTEWRFNSFPDLLSAQWDIDFRSNNTDFDRLLIVDDLWLYYSNEMSDTLVYGPDGGPPSWRNTAYLTISISGGNDVGDSDLIDFLKENATMI